MKLRNVPRNIPGYARRFYYYRRNSSPFLSGDLFADQSDVQMYSPKYRSKPPSLKDVADARVIFCPSHFLERFLEEYLAEAKKAKKFQEDLQKGEKIVTIAGIHGIVNKLNDDNTLQIEVSPGSFLKIEKSSISMEWSEQLKKEAVAK